MKTATGFTNLLKISKNIPYSEGWYIFVDLDFDNTKKCIESANYYLTETEEEDDDMDEQKDKYRSWLEYATFCAIIDNKLEHHPNASEDDLLEAVIYYLEEDAFID
ncbi:MULTISPECIES: hypothetical protein [Snodgrassella]|uniref:DUF7716 domain-containing protein n=1 Tax=Snodgrassella TaxID=1193515 RepID=UPI0004D92F40|nr:MULTISPECIES: hypothetical protein [unclassified Snodgrassella]KES11175.1 protein of unknown function (DUF3355) [Snodgrassella alvi SCGC AB-598-O11]MBI0069007.1 hypothetical protein [Snodgrassella sp. M0110]MBI0078008.1 hypothetical protein [Snodgrassella sp. M0118]MBI0080307.1 hypothetical protein [Snodgrassella sp. M0112]NUF78629.1 hypothetical protein [Snodgrassella sp. ESL0323]